MHQHIQAAGICKIIEVCFVLHDEPSGEPVDERPDEEQERLALGHGPGETWWRVRAFQYMCVAAYGCIDVAPDVLSQDPVAAHGVGCEYNRAC